METMEITAMQRIDTSGYNEARWNGNERNGQTYTFIDICYSLPIQNHRCKVTGLTSHVEVSRWCTHSPQHTYKDSTNIQSTCKSGARLNESSPPLLPELACALFNDTPWVACKSVSLSWVKTTQHQTAWLFIRVPAWHANRPQYEASSMQQCVFGLVANVFLVVLRNKAAERCGG